MFGWVGEASGRRWSFLAIYMPFIEVSSWVHPGPPTHPAHVLHLNLYQSNQSNEPSPHPRSES